jgi:hypothetical protein
MNIYVKRVAVVIPFVAMLLDVLSWFITKRFPVLPMWSCSAAR